MSRTALIMGATGLVGSHCLRALLASDVYQKILVLVRRDPQLQLSEAQQKKLQIHVVDFDKLDKHAELFSVDDVFCCLGTTLKQAGSIEAFKKVDYDYCLTSAQLAAQKNVTHFLIVTAVNAKANSLAYYSNTKGKLQNQLQLLGFKQLSIFQPSLLLGERKDFRLLEGLWGKSAKVMNKLLPEKMSAFRAIDGKVVGQAMVAVALNENLQKSAGALAFYHYDDMQKLSESLARFS
jgi:uncharacterized protein YbjT (DUF2867 family)